MLKAHTYKLGGREFATVPMPATESLVMLPRIIRLLGQDLTALLLMTDDVEPEAVEPGEGEAETATPKGGIQALLENREVMARVISTICHNAGPTGLVIIHEITRHTTVTTPAGPVSLYDVFDDFFAGDVIGMMTVAAHAMRSSFTRP
jgi:hypothetical protein